MAQPRPLAHAPITEALVDFRAVLAERFDASRLGALDAAVGYPTKEPARRVEAIVRFLPGAEPARLGTRKSDEFGYFYRTADRLMVAQFRLDGFTLNRLKPYTSWGELLPEALRLWALYLDIARPVSVPRLAVRFINHIAVPRADEAHRFLTSPPNVSVGAPGVCVDYLTRVATRDDERSISTVVTQAFRPGLTQEANGVVLDIDVFREAEFVEGGAEVEATLQRLREIKNNVFFASLTDQGIQRYE